MKLSNLHSITHRKENLALAEEQASPRTERANFSDKVKAEVFARDRAICGLSGVSLWLLDEGACGFYAWTHIDHIHPASKGGSNDISNAVTTHALYNQIKRDNVEAIYLFIDGVPTMDFFMVHRQLSPEMAQRLADFEEMHPSDYYFNSALGNVLGGVGWLHEGKQLGYTRTDEYYAKAALRRIREWKALVKKEEVASIEDRGLVMDPPLPDQELLLSLREKDSVEEIQKLMKKVLPYHQANTELVRAFQSRYEKYLNGEEVDFGEVLEFSDNPYVSNDTMGRMIINMTLILDPYADLKRENIVQEIWYPDLDEASKRNQVQIVDTKLFQPTLLIKGSVTKPA